ncbi:penicillin-binding transpeptidase domain-containing protein [Virgibacillus necropolis]|uniref:serine-type D-Ala-D-Ala carboxypeptidase n=1 Tax=Virgibacillus necropolis TaxID=163877 RepID=A0A221MDY1_9BACI|nr:penicillin-binding transpeptidase domain-containing protein [Virgibacillus necropolis]ASN05855.1 penicillin-binding protein [Virgibacillus necropolis]
MKKNKTTHFMAGILILLFVSVFLILTGRFMYIQATGEINNVSLEEWADKKRTASYGLDSERGKILDSNGMTLAYDRPTFKIKAIVDESHSEDLEEPQHVKNPEKTAEMLAPLLDMKQSEILDRINYGIENDKFQVEFGSNGKQLSQELKDKIEDLDLPGIQFDKQSIRYYPNGMFASHIIGFAQKEKGKITGVTGMERQMNDILSGDDGHISYQRDKFGTKLLDPNEVIEKPEDGDNVYLTINQKIQTLLEDTLTQVNEEYNPERITAIVMDPKTGEIVAMSNRPSYNPNNPSDVENWYNDAISTPFEPGSTMKMFTWAAAIDSGNYNGDASYLSGSYRALPNIKTIEDHNTDGWGKISFDEGFRRSSNVAAAKLLWEEMGPETYLNYYKAFEFDQKTGIDLPGEVTGKLVYDYPIEKITTSFGQGTTVTPIQQMKAATAIANDGKMLKPFVIKKVVDSSTGKTIKEKSPEVVGQPISKETANRVKELLGTVVTGEGGTGKNYKLDDYSVAGKTGTAQIPNPEGGGYLANNGNYVFSFLGMAPKNDPELMMYVSVKQPELENEAGSVPVSFIFKNVMKNGLHYLNIDPDKEATEKASLVKVPELNGLNTKDAKDQLSKLGFEHIMVIGNGNEIVNASAQKGEEMIANNRILLITDKPTMPDMTGWSMREVYKFADLIGLKVEAMGNGYVVKQSIKKGESIKENDYLGVEFKLPEMKKKDEAEKESIREEQKEEDALNESTEE